MTLRQALLAATSLLSAALLASLAGGCVAAPAGESDDVSTLNSAISADTAIARAEQWVAAELHYCQSPNHARDYDSACASTCERHDDAAWDPYRSDCSGLVSWAWGLPAPGRVTSEFAPFQTDLTHAITASNLQPGDAVNNSEHVMLFKAWVTVGEEAIFLEEPGCSSSTPYAHQVTSSVTVSGQSIHVAYNGMTFTAIRYDALNGGGGAAPPAPPPPAAATSCQVENVEGSCMLKSACAQKAGHVSTPGFCPGADDIECCTAPPACHVDGKAGLCMESSVCGSLPGHTSHAGLCPGPANEECCIP
jgi:hypothetical protein